MPSRDFSYIFDAMALLSHMTDTFIQDEDILGSIIFSTKGGFDNHAEVKISTSFINETPSVFGKVTTGQETCFPYQWSNLLRCGTYNTE